MTTDFSALYSNKVTPTKIVVVGDTILDMYVYGAVDKICQEDTCPRFNRAEMMYPDNGQGRDTLVDCDFLRPGGAAHVAAQAAVLGFDVTFITAIESSHNGRVVERLLTTAGVRIVNRQCCADYRNATKLRYVDTSTTKPRVVLCVSTDSVPQLGYDADRLVEAEIIDLCSRDYVAVMVNYQKGFLADGWHEDFEAFMNNARQVVITGRNAGDWKLRKGAIVVANEAETFAALRPVQPYGEYTEDMDLCARYHEFTNAQEMIVTRGAYGVQVFSPVGDTHDEDFDDATFFEVGGSLRQVVDVTGAGDVFLAGLACLLAVLPPEARLADHSSSLEWVAALAELSTELFATTPVPLIQLLANAEKTLILDTAKVRNEFFAALRRSQHRSGVAIEFTNGCFDVFHAGHLACLQEFDNACYMVVAINSDESVKRLKGADRPIQTFDVRAEVVASLPCVKLVLQMHQDSPEYLLRNLQPVAYFKGATTDSENMPGADLVIKYGGVVSYGNKLVPGMSTTTLIDGAATLKGPEVDDNDERV